MAISKTHEKGYTVYCKETKTDLKSLMNKYINKEISGKPLSSGNAMRSVELVEYNSQKFIIKNDREVDPRFEKKMQNFISGPFYSWLIKKLDTLSRKCAPVQPISTMPLKKYDFVSVMMFILFMNMLKALL